MAEEITEITVRPDGKVEMQVKGVTLTGASRSRSPRRSAPPR